MELWEERLRPLVVLLGCPALHDEMCQGVPGDRLRLSCITAGMDYQFPVSKPSRSVGKTDRDYDGYQPPGILSAAWLSKHTRVVPGAVALLFEFQPGVATWDALEEEIIDGVAMFRSNNLTRSNLNVVLGVICHQDADGVFPDQEQLATLRKRTGLDTNAEATVVLPAHDLQGGLIRLEEALWRVVEQHYTAEAKRIKRSRDRLSKYSQQTLITRLSFKLAIFSHFLKDAAASARYLEHAYNTLLEYSCPLEEVLEVKAVSFELAWRLWRQWLQAGEVSEAVEHFRRHVQHFSQPAMHGFSRCAHHAFLSLQYHTLAVFLSVCGHAGAMATRLHHPGMYFHAAAKHLHRRKERGLEEFTAEQLSAPRRPRAFCGYFVGKCVAEQEAVDTRHSIVSVCASEEASYPYSTELLALYKSAYECFLHQGKKTRVSARQNLSIASDMASEYMHQGQHVEARRFLESIARVYRKEGWLRVLSSVLLRTIECCRVLQVTEPQLAAYLELLQPGMPLDEKHKGELHSSLLNVISNTPPPASPLSFDTTTWGLLPAKVDMHLSDDQEHIELHLELQSRFPLSINFSKIEVVFSKPCYNLVISESSLTTTAQHVLTAATHFEGPLHTRHYAHTIPRLPMEHDVAALAVQCHVGAVMLSCTPGGGHDRSEQLLSIPAPRCRLVASSSSSSPAALLTHQPQTLLVDVRGRQGEEQEKVAAVQEAHLYIGDVPDWLTVSHPSLQDNRVPLPSPPPCTLPLTLHATRASQQHAFSLCVRHCRPAEGGEEMVEHSTDVALSFDDPLQVSFNVVSDNWPVLAQATDADYSVFRKDRLLLCVDVTNVSGVPVELHGVALSATTAFRPHPSDPIHQQRLRPQDTFTMCVAVDVVGPGDMGQAVVTWSDPRASASAPPSPSPSECVVALPRVHVLERPQVPVTVQCDVPRVCTLGEHVTLSYRLDNLSSHAQRVTVSSAEHTQAQAFVCSGGVGQGTVTVLPHCSRVVSYELFPLRCGWLTPPRMEWALLTSSHGKRKSVVLSGEAPPGDVFVSPAPCRPPLA